MSIYTDIGSVNTNFFCGNEIDCSNTIMYCNAGKSYCNISQMTNTQPSCYGDCHAVLDPNTHNFIHEDVFFLVISLLIGLLFLYCFGKWFARFCEKRGLRRERQLMAIERNEHMRQMSSLNLKSPKLNVIVSNLDAKELAKANKNAENDTPGTNTDYEDE
jgi:hypothetical protein